MSSNLLSTKLFIPEPRQDYIIRPKLLDLLDGALSSKLILVAAPPGYGKTTLLSIWIKERSIPTAWLSLDSGDNDQLLFTHYLISALQYISPDIGQASLTLLKSTQASSPTSILSALLNDLTRLEGDIVLVLDDYHIIESQNVQLVARHKTQLRHRRNTIAQPVGRQRFAPRRKASVEQVFDLPPILCCF